jgi:D-alanyl-D-alanine carboxypeptidase/D-alanyl-D-alanine-endopeptidase (penicillin-binding protein 4)
MNTLLRSLAIVCSALLLAACASTSHLPQRGQAPITMLSVSPYPTLKASIDALIPDTLFPPSNVGIKVVSLIHNESLYELNPRMLFNPASNQKLFTSATALSLLGDTFPLITSASIDTVARLIIVKGGGDPILSTADAESLAHSIRSVLPPGGAWRLAGDMSYFDDLWWGAGWTWDEEPSDYGMFITPLMLNHNTITVRVIPGNKPGDSVQAVLDPATAYATVENQGVTVTDTVRTPLEISRRWRERSNVITVRGEMMKNDTGTSVALSVWRPERYALTVIAERLAALGVTVDLLPTDTTVGATMPAVTFVHRLDTVATFMNKVSDNLSAEALLKTLAAEKIARPGSAVAGVSVVKQFLVLQAIDTTRIAIVDGSGLSRYNLTNAETVIELLRGMYFGNQREAFRHTLPIAGIDGTIGHRMRRSAAEGNLHAKTGTLSAVTALSGYVTTAEGEPLAFSILMQNYPDASRPYRAVQDRIGALLAAMRRSAL